MAAPALPAQPIITAPRPTSTNQPDPLAAFMISQPPIDTESPIQVVAEFDPATISIGQSAVYRVTLNVMEQSIEWPEIIPTPQGCTMRSGASGQFLQNLGGAIVPRTTFLYHIQPADSGVFILPAYTVRARGRETRVPPATLTVVTNDSSAVEAPPLIQLAADGTEFFVGQNIELKVSFPGKADGTVQTLSQVEVVGENLIVDRNFRAQRIVTQIENGVSKPLFIYEALATPMRPGRTKVIAKGFTVGPQLQGPIAISGTAILNANQPTYTLVDSGPLVLNILSLPRESELPGFTGAIGRFAMESPLLSTNRVRAGDLITLSLTLRGIGNLERVLPPEIESQPEWQVFQSKKENTPPAIIRQRGFVTFEYKLIPLDDTIRNTPPIPFCYFDPDSRTYVDQSIVPIPIEVDPSPAAASTKGQPTLIEARSFLRKLLKKPEEPTALAPILESRGRTAASLTPTHQQAWFTAMQFIPATLLGGLWFWDRRRRFLEQHPEVVIRRRARKAIQRHAKRARRAARGMDSPQFLHHAIQGFREACAPAAPADPRALVCDDVLAAIPDSLRTDQTLRVVSKLFAVANEWRFGNVQPDSQELLGLAQEVDQQLNSLRGRL